MLSYLHHAAVNGVVVTEYVDHPTGVLTEDEDGGGKFTDITLHPIVTVADEAMLETAERLHHDANRTCFIASSLALPVQHDVTTVVSAA
jgi:organic hydroperoxide reductase OsmC/OhrA